jgi:hypothetical protein
VTEMLQEQEAPADAVKRCTRCLEEKPLDELHFGRKQSGKWQSWCRECCARPYTLNVIQKPPEPDQPALPKDTGDLRITAEHAAIITASGWAAIESMKRRRERA